MLYSLAWTCHRRAVRYPLLLAINFFTIYTGFGLLLGLLTPALLVLDYRSDPQERLPMADLVGTMVVSLLSLGSFFIGYKFDSALDCFSPQPLSPKYYVAYVAFMFAHFFAVDGLGTPQLIRENPAGNAACSGRTSEAA